MTEFASLGTLLKVGDGGATEAFTTLAQCGDISGPSLGAAQVEVTNHDSPGNYREYVPTFLEPGELTVTIFYDPADATHDPSTGILTEYEARTKRNFQLVFSDTATTTWTFAAYVTGFEPQAPVDGALTANITLMLTGQPTLA
jgi:predicted secreted protein